MMVEDELRRKVIDTLAEEFELDPALLVPEATLYEDLGLDSLDAVDMVVALERVFQTKLTDEDALRSIRTMDDLIQFLMKIREEKQVE